MHYIIICYLVYANIKYNYIEKIIAGKFKIMYFIIDYIPQYLKYATR